LGREHGGGEFFILNTSFLFRLNLKPEQTAKINAFREANLRDIKPIQDKMFSKRGDVGLLWLQTNPDQEKIMAAQKEISALRDKMQDKITGYWLDFLKVLTSEQQEKVKSFKMGRGFGPGVRCGTGYHDGGRCVGGPGSSPGYGPRGN
jgi:Spy/CpxP family protein refolding chaperone